MPFRISWQEVARALVIIMFAVIAIGLIAIQLAFCASPLTKTAVTDRKQFAQTEWPYTFYLIADETTATILGFVLSSTSTTEEIELCLPQFVAPGLYRIDIRALGWRSVDWQHVLSAHPYGGFTLLIRGDWLLTELLDAQLSAASHSDGIASYYRLLYHGKPPKTETEFLAAWDVDPEKGRHRGQIEGVSQVNRRGRRWIEIRDRHGGYFFITRDSFALDTDSDPLERPDGSFRHDGSEAIVGLSKYSAATGERGAVQYYHLFNGQGGSVDEAPVQLVEDHTRFRNVASIRTWGSCLKCHVEGIRPVETNALRDISEKHGTAVFSSDPTELRRFHFGDLSREISRCQEDYEAGVRLHTGWTIKQLIEGVESVIRGYDAPLELDRAAEELGVSAERLQQTIRHYGQANPVPAGIAVLAGGGQCSRDLFAQQYALLDDLLKNFPEGGD